MRRLLSRAGRPAAVLAVLGALGPSGCDLGTGPRAGPPTIDAVSPAPGSRGVAVLSGVTLTFSEPLDVGSLQGAVTLSANDRTLHVDATYRNDGTIHLQPASPLDFGTLHRIRVDGGITDTQGSALGAARTFTFTTEGAPLPAPDPDTLLARVAALAHDSLQGRKGGSDDELRAARWVEELMAGWGLEPLDGAFIHPFQGFSGLLATQVHSRNVLGAVRGRGDLADRWVVVGGHYDHVGVRPHLGDEVAVHNGADDNASGTAAMLELARLYAAAVAQGGLGSRHRRSVLFAAWGAEEDGLLGSCAFVSEGLLPVARTAAVLNFDMVGRLRDGRVYARGRHTDPHWPAFVEDANRPELLLDDATARELASDHRCFHEAGVPYLWFFTGPHSDYHTPDDDVELIDEEGMAAVAEIGLRLLVRVAVASSGPGSPP